MYYDFEGHSELICHFYFLECPWSKEQFEKHLLDILSMYLGLCYLKSHPCSTKGCLAMFMPPKFVSESQDPRTCHVRATVLGSLQDCGTSLYKAAN